MVVTATRVRTLPNTKFKDKNLKALPYPGQFEEIKKLYDAGDLQAALALAKSNEENEPDNVLLLNFIGILLTELRKPVEGTEYFKRAIAIEPGYSDAHYNYGRSLSSNYQLSSAIKQFEYARALNPNQQFAELAYADALKDAGLLAEAATVYENLMEQGYETNLVKGALATIYKNFGQFEKSRSLAMAVLEDNMANNICDAGQLYNFAVDGKKEDAERILEFILKILEEHDVTPESKAMLFVAAANLFFKLGNYDLGMRFLKEGKEDYARAKDYDFDNYRKGVVLPVKFFAQGGYSQYQGPPSKVTPIFILGMPRSGTTLLEQMICSHDLVHGAGELESMRLSVFEAGAFKKKLDEAYVLSVREGYFSRLAERNPKNLPFVTDKMPLNFRWIGFIRACLPEAKIIHIRRHPNAVCWSNYKTFFPASGMGFTSLQESLGQYYQYYADAMDFWRNAFPGEFQEIYYEQLTADPEPIMRQLLTYIGVDWDPRVLSPDKNSRAIKTASAAQVRNKIYTGSSEQWKKYADHIPTLLRWTRPHVEAYEQELFALMDSSHMTQ